MKTNHRRIGRWPVMRSGKDLDSQPALRTEPAPAATHNATPEKRLAVVTSYADGDVLRRPEFSALSKDDCEHRRPSNGPVHRIAARENVALQRDGGEPNNFADAPQADCGASQ
jgi:hypothetical protein